MYTDIILFFALVIVGGLIWLYFFELGMVKAQQVVNTWAEGQHYDILESHYCWFYKGPFFLRSSKSQMVFHIAIRDAVGHSYSGWARTGNWWFGVLGSDEIKVVWDMQR